jgi:hypothetical protein
MSQAQQVIPEWLQSMACVTPRGASRQSGYMGVSRGSFVGFSKRYQSYGNGFRGNVYNRDRCGTVY